MRIQDAIQRPGAPGYFYRKIGLNDTHGVFSIARMAVPAQMGRENGMRRCDGRRKVGPLFHHTYDIENGLCSCGSSEEPSSLTGHHIIRFGNIAALYPVIEVPNYGVILYYELDNASDEDLSVMAHHSESSRTLQELFRLMLEWKSAFVGGVAESLAETCYNMWNALDVPEQVENWLTNDMPPEKVNRYLEGDPQARIRNPLLIPDIPDFFSEWLYNQIISCNGIGTYDRAVL